MMVAAVKGRFSSIDGAIVVDEEEPGRSSVGQTIDAASVDTREPQRDGHLKSADFLNVEEFPHIIFRGTRLDRVDDQRFCLYGYLAVRDVTRPVVL